MDGYGVWFSSAFAGALMTLALGWAAAKRRALEPALAHTNESATRYSVAFWSIAGAVAFLLPILIYWLSARSHGNALAGFLPWNDASGYFACSESYLLGFDPSGICSRRPFYFAFFANLLWVTGNLLQLALLLQAFLVGCATVLLARAFARELGGPGMIALYCVVFLFAAALCAGLVMTENAGLLLGLLAVAILWRVADEVDPLPFLLALVLMAAAQNSRAGALFVLPALIAWVVFHGGGSWRRRLAIGIAGFAAIAVGIALASAPALIVNGSLGGAQANFSYSLYGLVTGGNKWTYVYETRPDIFAAGGGEGEVARRIYWAALESVLARPRLAALGYLKGLGEYLEDLFKYVGEFKPLRYGFFVLLWLAGVWGSLRRWRDRRYALLLWMQLGILLSSPFLSIDGISRVYAATVGVDAVFVGLGMAWVSGRLAKLWETESRHLAEARSALATVIAIAVSVLLLPLAFLIAVRAVAASPSYAAPVCAENLQPVVIRPGRSTLVLPLVAPGNESFFPLRVRADHFAARMDKSVSSPVELRRKAGETLIWGYRLDDLQPGTTVRFAWEGTELPESRAVGFCVKPPEVKGGNIGTAVGVPIAVSQR